MNSFVKYLFGRGDITNNPKLEESQPPTSKSSGGLSLGFQKRQLQDTSQFEDYLMNLPVQLKKLKRKIRAGQNNRPVTSNSVRMQLLEKLYRNIPRYYFEDKGFQIEFKMFFRQKRKTEQSQEKIYQYLDQVQLCLFNQVTSRFDQFLSAMVAIQSIEYIITDNIEKIKKIRETNFQMTQYLVKKTSRIVYLQTVYKNKQEVLKLLQKVNLLMKAQVIIKTEVNKNKDKCLNLLQQIKGNRQQLLTIKSLQTIYDNKVQQCQSILKKDFTQTFSQETYLYIINAGTYNPNFWDSLSGQNYLVSQTTMINQFQNTLFLEEDIWQQTQKKNPIDRETENKILQIILNGWKNGELGVGPTKAKIDKFISGLFNQYVADIKGFAYKKLKEHGEQVNINQGIEQLLQKMSLQFYGKVLEYYSDLHKKYLKRNFSLFKLVIDDLLQLSITINKNQNQMMPKMSNLIEGLFNIQLFLIKIILERVIQLLNYKKIHSDIQYNKFKSYIGLFQNWQKFFEHQVSPLIQYKIPTECPMKQRAYVLKNKINVSYLTNNKNQLITSYFSSLHKFVINRQLKQALQDDAWIAVDIPTDFYNPIGYLISGECWVSNRKNLQNTIMQSSIFMDRQQSSFLHHRSSRGDRSSFMKVDEVIQGNAAKINFKIIKNQCIIGQKTYKITEAFLLLIQILQEYVRVSQCFPIIKEEVSIKITQLCNFYNSYTLQLIIGGGACIYQKIKGKSITARHLALSSLCIQFLSFIMKKVSERIKVSNLNQCLQNLQVHNLQIIKKLKLILISKIQQSIQLIDLKLAPSKGTQTIVSSTRTLFDILSQYFTTQAIKKIFDGQIFEKYLQRIKRLQVKGLQQAQIFKEQINFMFNELKFLQNIIQNYEQKRLQGQSLIMKVFEAL